MLLVVCVFISYLLSLKKSSCLYINISLLFNSTTSPEACFIAARSFSMCPYISGFTDANVTTLASSGPPIQKATNYGAKYVRSYNIAYSGHGLKLLKVILLEFVSSYGLFFIQVRMNDLEARQRWAAGSFQLRCISNL